MSRSFELHRPRRAAAFAGRTAMLAAAWIVGIAAWLVLALRRRCARHVVPGDAPRADGGDRVRRDVADPRRRGERRRRASLHRQAQAVGRAAEALAAPAARRREDRAREGRGDARRLPVLQPADRHALLHGERVGARPHPRDLAAHGRGGCRLPCARGGGRGHGAGLALLQPRHRCALLHDRRGRAPAHPDHVAAVPRRGRRVPQLPAGCVRARAGASLLQQRDAHALLHRGRRRARPRAAHVPAVRVRGRRLLRRRARARSGRRGAHPRAPARRPGDLRPDAGRGRPRARDGRGGLGRRPAREGAVRLSARRVQLRVARRERGLQVRRRARHGRLPLRDRAPHAVQDPDAPVPERAAAARPAAPARGLGAVADPRRVRHEGPGHGDRLRRGALAPDARRARVRQLRGAALPDVDLAGDGALPRHDRQLQGRPAGRDRAERELRARAAAALLDRRGGAETRRHAAVRQRRAAGRDLRAGGGARVRARAHRLDLPAVPGHAAQVGGQARRDAALLRRADGRAGLRARQRGEAPAARHRAAGRPDRGRRPARRAAQRVPAPERRAVHRAPADPPPRHRRADAGLRRPRRRRVRRQRRRRARRPGRGGARDPARPGGALAADGEPALRPLPRAGAVRDRVPARDRRGERRHAPRRGDARDGAEPVLRAVGLQLLPGRVPHPRDRHRRAADGAAQREHRARAQQLRLLDAVGGRHGPRHARCPGPSARRST